MNKKKKVIIILIACLLSAIFVSGAIFHIVKYYNERIVFAINDTLADGQGRKAKVILLGGQSNATGCSLDEYLQKKTSEEKYSDYENGYDNVYINYYCSGKNMSEGFVKCSTCQGEDENCFGPELGLAEKLNEMYPDELFFIVKYAWGASDLYSQWLSPSSPGKTGKFYKGFTTFVNTSIRYLISKNYDVSIEAMCWMQGESDSFFVSTATDYKDNLNNFIQDMRKAFSRYASEDGIAFVDAYIANNPSYWVYGEFVNQSKKLVEQMSPLNVLIDTIAHGLICYEEPEGAPDIPHYDSLSEIKLGHLFAKEVMKFF